MVARRYVFQKHSRMQKNSLLKILRAQKKFIQSTNSFSPTETLGNQSPLIDPNDLTVLPENEQLSVFPSEDIVDHPNEFMFMGYPHPHLVSNPMHLILQLRLWQHYME